MGERLLYYDVPPAPALPGVFLCPVVGEDMTVRWDGGRKPARVVRTADPLGPGCYPLKLLLDEPGGPSRPSPPGPRPIGGVSFLLWLADRPGRDGLRRFPQRMSAGCRDEGSAAEYRLYADRRLLDGCGLDRASFYRGLAEGRYAELLPHACVTTADREHAWWDVQLRGPTGEPPSWEEWPLDPAEFDAKWRRVRLGEEPPDDDRPYAGTNCTTVS